MPATSIRPRRGQYRRLLRAGSSSGGSIRVHITLDIDRDPVERDGSPLRPSGPFANLMQRRARPNFEVQTEVRLTIEPQRADMLLLRRLDAANRDAEAKLLRNLWHRLGRVTIVEFKSPVESPLTSVDQT